MNKTLIISFISFLVLSCSDPGEYRSPGRKVKYDLLNEFLNHHIFIPSGNGLRPVMYSGCINQIMPGKQIKEQLILYIENLEEPFSEEDKNYMKWQLEKDWNIKINRSLIDNYNITVIKDPESDRSQLCNSMILFLSPPVFSIRKDQALIWQSLEYKSLQAGFVCTLEKQKNRWIMSSYDNLREP